MPIPFERDIPRFPGEPPLLGYPTNPEESFFDDRDSQNAADIVSRYIAEENANARGIIVRDILRSRNRQYVQFYVGLLLLSVYGKPLEEQPLDRKLAYQKLVNRIAEAEGRPIFPLRHKIDELMEREGPDAVTQIPGISIVARSEDRPPDEDCFEFAYGEWYYKQYSLRLKNTGKAPGVLVQYYNPALKTITHTGIVAPNGMVHSKWGPDGHIYEHSPESVPTIYGYVAGYQKIIS